jgi:hypothetical protein
MAPVVNAIITFHSPIPVDLISCICFKAESRFPGQQQAINTLQVYESCAREDTAKRWVAAAANGYTGRIHIATIAGLVAKV